MIRVIVYFRDWLERFRNNYSKTRNWLELVVRGVREMNYSITKERHREKQRDRQTDNQTDKQVGDREKEGPTEMYIWRARVRKKERG